MTGTGNKKMGRPLKYTAELAQKIAMGVMAGLPEDEAAARVGIDRATLFNWLKAGRAGDSRYAELVRLLERAKSLGSKKRL